MKKLNNKTKFHIHIYKITGKAETSVREDSETKAKIKALRRRKKLKFKKADCDYIAFAFNEAESKYV